MVAYVRKILIVEDEKLFSALLKDVLERENFDVRIAKNVPEAKKALATFDPDLVLLDVSLGEGPPGTQLAYYIDKKHPGTAIIFLTKHPDLLTAGINPTMLPPDCGFLRKDLVSDSAYLIDSINQVLSNKADQVRHGFTNDSPFARLTPIQLDVLRLVAQGLTNQAIAEERGISLRAVEKNLTAIFTTFGLDASADTNNRVQAALMYVTQVGPADPTGIQP